MTVTAPASLGATGTIVIPGACGCCDEVDGAAGGGAGAAACVWTGAVELGCGAWGAGTGELDCGAWGAGTGELGWGGWAGGLDGDGCVVVEEDEVVGLAGRGDELELEVGGRVVVLVWWIVRVVVCTAAELGDWIVVGEDAGSLVAGFAAGMVVVGVADGGAEELAGPGKASVARVVDPGKASVVMVVDVCGDDAADAASVCEDCGTSLGFGVKTLEILDGAEDCRTAPELATPGNVSVAVTVDVCGDDAADAARVCEVCETALGLDAETLGILEVAADCRTALELATEVLATLDVPDATTRPSIVSARLGAAHPIVMPDWPPSSGSAKQLWP